MDEVIVKAFEAFMRKKHPNLGSIIDMSKPINRKVWEKELRHFSNGWRAREERVDLSIDLYAKRFAGGTDVH